MKSNNKNSEIITEQISESIKALAHPERLRMILLFGRNKSVGITVSNVHQKLGLTQPETSRHLSILKSKNILTSRKDGSNVFYSINKNNKEITKLVECLQTILKK